MFKYPSKLMMALILLKSSMCIITSLRRANADWSKKESECSLDDFIVDS